MSPQQFRKKPVVIEAIQFDGTNSDEIEEWSQFAVRNSKPWKKNYGFMDVKTLEGYMLVTPGDWVIRGVKDEFYPCKPDIFEATYELEEAP